MDILGSLPDRSDAPGRGNATAAPSKLISGRPRAKGCARVCHEAGAILGEAHRDLKETRLAWAEVRPALPEKGFKKFQKPI